MLTPELAKRPVSTLEQKKIKTKNFHIVELLKTLLENVRVGRVPAVRIPGTDDSKSRTPFLAHKSYS
jgi:hypothetical protein